METNASTIVREVCEHYRIDPAVLAHHFVDLLMSNAEAIAKFEIGGDPADAEVLKLLDSVVGQAQAYAAGAHHAASKELHDATAVMLYSSPRTHEGLAAREREARARAAWDAARAMRVVVKNALMAGQHVGTEEALRASAG